MKTNIVLLILLLLCLKVNGQNKISGRITNSSGEALIGATVYLPELNKGTITNENGEFTISHLPSTSIKIQFSHVGYETLIKTMELKESETRIEVVLKEAMIKSPEVIISGGYIGNQHESSKKIDKIKINLTEVKATPNFTEMLTSVPGVDMISKGSGVSKPVIRGLSMNDILVLNNGVRFENYQYSDHHPLGIDEFGIDEVEIIKGPASLLYGSDAIGGVINFIKEKPAPVGSLMGDYNLQLFSNSLGITNNLGIKGATKKLYGGVRFGNKTNADYLQGGGDFVPNSRANELSLKTNFGYTDKLGKFNLFYDFNNQKLGLVEDEAIEAIHKRSRKNKIFYQEFNNHLAAMQNTIFLKKFTIEANSGFQNTELIHFGEENVYELQMQLSTLTYELKLKPSISNGDLLIAIQGFNQTNKNINDRETKLLPDAQTNNYSVYVFLQHNILKSLKFQTGLRSDIKNIRTKAIIDEIDSLNNRPAITKNYNNISGIIGISQNFTDKLFLKLSFANAYRTPNLAELTSNGPHELRFEVGNPNLKTENSYSTDLSIHYHQKHLMFDAGTFYNLINNYIYITPTNDTAHNGMTIYRYKQNNAVIYGGEAVVTYNPPYIKWLNVETTFAYVLGTQKNKEYLPLIPAPKLNFDVSSEFKNVLFYEKLNVSVCLHNALNKNKIAPEETQTRGYSIVDFKIGGEIKASNQKVLLFFSVNNIFDTKYIDHLSTLKETGFYNPGRNFTLSLKVPFEARRRR